jgi:hypothetical protein
VTKNSDYTKDITPELLNQTATVLTFHASYLPLCGLFFFFWGGGGLGFLRSPGI